jgi:protoheme ferro-lyase
MATNTSQVGVILMTYGSPATLDDIPTYLKNIRGGRTESLNTSPLFIKALAAVVQQTMG